MTARTLPDSLTERDQWGLWRRERDTKVPYSVTGRRASSTDPRTWTTYAQAAAALDRDPKRWAGLAWFFSTADPFVGVDLDDCLGDDGLPLPWAQGVIERFADSYMETSPSGRGVKIWCKGKLPANLAKVAITGGGGVEMYDHARFFAVTGRRFRGAPQEIEDHAQDVIDLYTGLTRGRGRWQQQPDTGGKIPHGRQHHYLVSLAGTLTRRGVCPEAIEACLQAVNERQCERPGPRANIAKIVRSRSLWLARPHTNTEVAS
jgi:hypothetical protein